MCRPTVACRSHRVGIAVTDRDACRPGTTVSLLITTNEIVHLARPGASLTERAGALDISDLVIDAYGVRGRALGILKPW